MEQHDTVKARLHIYIYIYIYIYVSADVYGSMTQHTCDNSKCCENKGRQQTLHEKMNHSGGVNIDIMLKQLWDTAFLCVGNLPSYQLASMTGLHPTNKHHRDKRSWREWSARLTAWMSGMQRALCMLTAITWADSSFVHSSSMYDYWSSADEDIALNKGRRCLHM